MNSSTIKNLINDPTAILVSGGLDSAILLADMVNHKFPKVWPVFVQCGLYWEKTELEYLRRFINAIKAPNLAELIILDVPVGDLYKDHWSLTGINVPDVKSPDEAVFLPGRNVLLTAKALLWCNLNQVKSLSLAVLESNPFPDATDSFFLTMEQAINESVSGNVKLLRPYAGMHKTDVLKIGRNAPLEHTFSCIYPINGMHCGKCNKCAERKNGFSQASMKDPTSYS
ncbi:MAG: 7-cyano-7-deazaguanine synthase [Planctomycetota bacterium]|nr:7-cyano-7-deazaguanine synthase [Gemmataceae bacterium]RLS60606.1 MAG: 7-cyano-7-deazaguanine synthase [Planctomycetota bacterium]